MADDRKPGAPWRGFAVLVVVFIAGALAGSVGGRMALRRELQVGAGGWSAEREAGRRRIQAPVDIDQIPTPLIQLGLTPDQEARLHDIARRWRPRAATELSEMRERVGELENGMFADMLCVITPAQQDRYLAVLQGSHAPQALIDKRFANVRAKTCPSPTTPP